MVCLCVAKWYVGKLKDLTVPVLDPKKYWRQPTGARFAKSQLYWDTLERSQTRYVEITHT